jgi:hypothetical protein
MSHRRLPAPAAAAAATITACSPPSVCIRDSAIHSLLKTRVIKGIYVRVTVSAAQRRYSLRHSPPDPLKPATANGTKGQTSTLSNCRLLARYTPFQFCVTALARVEMVLTESSRHFPLQNEGSGSCKLSSACGSSQRHVILHGCLTLCSQQYSDSSNYARNEIQHDANLSRDAVM